MANNIYDSIPTEDSPKTQQGNVYDSVPQQSPIGPSGGKQSAWWDSIDIMNRNFAKIANGDLQLGAQALQALGVDTSGFQKNIAQQQAIHERDYKAALENSPTSGTITDIGSKIAAAVATPGSQGLMGGMAAGNIAGNMFRAGGASALTGAQEYQENGGIGTHLDAGIQSGLVGGALQGIGEKIIQGVKGVAENSFKRPVQEAADLADQGLVTTMGNATQNPTLQTTENVLGRLPLVGAKRGINKQANILKTEASDVLGEFNSPNLKTELSSAIKNSYGAAKINTDKAYSEALNIASHNKLSIPLNETQSVAKQAVSQLNDLKAAGISSSSSKVGTLINDMSDMSEIPAKTFDTLRKKLSNIKLIDDTEGLAPVLKQLKSSMDMDLEAAGGLNKTFGQALTKARSVYQTEKAPFKDVPELKKIISGKLDSDQLINAIVKDDRPELSQKIMGALSPEGQKLFSKSIITKTMQDSLDKHKVLDLEDFTTQLHKLGDTLSVLPKDEQMKIKGLQKLLVESDNLIKSNKVTANSMSNWLGGIGSTLGTGALLGLGGVATAIGGTAFTKTLSWAMTSPKMTKLLIKLGGGKMGQTAQEGIVKSALKLMIRKGSIPAAASSGQNIQEQPKAPISALGILG